MAEPSWVEQADLRANVTSVVGQNLIRGITKDGEIFTVNPAGFWSKGKYRPFRWWHPGADDNEPVLSATFNLPDGGVTFGGHDLLNYVWQRGGDPFKVCPGGIDRPSKNSVFESDCFVTAVSRKGQLVGMMDSGKRDLDATRAILMPCRIDNGRARPLPLPEGMYSNLVWPRAMNSRGDIIATAPDPNFSPPDRKSMNNSGMSIVWLSNKETFTTRDRFKSTYESVRFHCISDDRRFGGCIEDGENISHPIVSDGKTIERLPEPEGANQTSVNQFIPGGYAGSFHPANRWSYHREGCIWIKGKLYILSDLVKLPDGWVVGQVEAVGKNGELAVNMIHLSETYMDLHNEYEHRVGMLIPRP